MVVVFEKSSNHNIKFHKSKIVAINVVPTVTERTVIKYVCKLGEWTVPVEYFSFGHQSLIRFREDYQYGDHLLFLKEGGSSSFKPQY